MKKQKIIVFDFDGTLTASDANAEFLKYCFRHSIRPWLFLPVMAFALFLKNFENHNDKLSAGKSARRWRELLRRFITRDLIERLKPGFIKEFKKFRFDWAKQTVADEHSASDVQVILLSAGMDYLIPQLVDDMDFDWIITSKTNPRRPWKFEGFCYGKNKVVALNEWGHENKIIPLVVRSYADSESDKFLMAIAEQKIWIDSKTGKRK